MDTLEKVLEYLNSIPNIHCGGCGIAALAIFRWLRKNRLKATICYNYRYRDYGNRARMEKGQRLRVPNHVTVEFRGTLIDPDGIGKVDSCFMADYHPVKVKHLLDTLKDISGWNPDFDRRFVTQIERKLNVKLI